MSTREKFALAALHALIETVHSPLRNAEEAVSINDLVFDAVRYADALIKELQKKENEEDKSLPF